MSATCAILFLFDFRNLDYSAKIGIRFDSSVRFFQQAVTKFLTLAVVDDNVADQEILPIVAGFSQSLQASRELTYGLVPLVKAKNLNRHMRSFDLCSQCSSSRTFATILQRLLQSWILNKI